MNNDLVAKLTKNRAAMTKEAAAVAKIEAGISQAIAVHKDKLTTLRQRDAELQAALKQFMKETGNKKIENELLVITYVAPVTRRNIDVVRLREEHPEITEQYTVESTTSDSIRIKVKE